MKRMLIVVLALMLSACSSLPEKGDGIEGLSFTDFNGQPAAIFEDRDKQTIVFGDMQSGEIRVFSQGQWNPTPPAFEEPFQPDSSFDGKLIVPMLSGSGFIFEPPSAPGSPEPDPDALLLLVGLDQNPCLPNAGCGGDFGRSLRRVFESRTAFSCPDANVTVLFRSREACEEECSSPCRGELSIIGR